MGDWDFYCALCASSFHKIDADDNPIASVLEVEGEREGWEEENLDEFNGVGYNGRKAWIQKYFPQATLRWHGELHALAYNTEKGKAWISGQGWWSSYGSIHVSPGQDEGAPDEGGICLHAYTHIDEIDEFGLPVHENCFSGILPRAIGFAFGQADWTSWTAERIEKDLLYMVTHRVASKSAFTLPQIDYGERNSEIQQYWGVYWSDLCSISDPLNIPSLRVYYENLPKLQALGTDTPTLKSTFVPGNDSFLQLSTELILAIADLLPIRDFVALRASSRTTSVVLSTPSIWRKMIDRDMPWLWELQGIDDAQVTDWYRVYKDLYRGSFEQPTLGNEASPKNGQHPGLWNRRRIWKACIQVAKLYTDEHKASKGTDAWGHWKPQCGKDCQA
ncbi:MAG: hypothetical protein Q9227_005630 [Pyrenula ochraceoflavens]